MPPTVGITWQMGSKAFEIITQGLDSNVGCYDGVLPQ